jgi:hypothetical protein
VTYAGPDGPATLQGNCRDRAGNAGAPTSFALRYDATPPTMAGVSASGGDTLVTVAWRAAGADRVIVARSPGARGAASTMVYSGPGRKFIDTGLRNGVRYRYTVSATDAAGNETTATATATPRSRLLAPRPAARLTHAPVLRWRAVARARYYNVQLFRGGRKILSAWPARARLAVRPSWHYRGRTQRLKPGRYRWYVWPGYGRRSAHHYGRLLGFREFTVRARRLRAANPRFRSFHAV